MRAIILASSPGTGFATEASADTPPCLLEAGGRSLISLQLDGLFRCGIRSADLVVGHEARLVIDHVGTLSSRPDVAFHFNPRYESGSVLSLLAAAETLESGDDVLLLDAGMFLDPQILERLVDSKLENGFVLDRGEVDGVSPDVVLHDGRIADFDEEAARKAEQSAVSLGLYRFGPEAGKAIAEECARHELEGLEDAPYEHVIRNVLRSCPLAFGFVDITGLSWACV